MNPISSFWRGRQHLSPLSPSTVLSTLTPKVGDMATPLPSSKEGAAVVTSNDQGHLLPTLCTHLTLVSPSLQALPHLILWSPYHCGPALIPDPGTMAAPRHWATATVRLAMPLTLGQLGVPAIWSPAAWLLQGHADSRRSFCGHSSGARALDPGTTATASVPANWTQVSERTLQPWQLPWD